MLKVKRASIAFLLSTLVPGLGQIYNGQLLTGILLAAAFGSFTYFVRLLGLLHTFRTTVVCLGGSGIFQLGVALYAAVVAARQVKNNIVPAPSRRSYQLGGLVLGSFALIGIIFSNDGILGVRAYKVPAQSMSPTLVPGDRFTVDVKYYENRRPGRGDVIVFRMPAPGVLITKRVIAVGGDTIEGGPKGTIVNGQLLPEPYMLHATGEIPADSNPKFGPLCILSKELFVMGDNREESYDSRYFGPVSTDRVIGKALYIYYSSADKSRIGRAIQ